MDEKDVEFALMTFLLNNIGNNIMFLGSDQDLREFSFFNGELEKKLMAYLMRELRVAFEISMIAPLSINNIVKHFEDLYTRIDEETPEIKAPEKVLFSNIRSKLQRR